MLDVNLWGVIHGCHSFVPRMKRRGGGRILNVASLAGVMPLPYMGAYAATKAAVISLSRDHAGRAGQREHLGDRAVPASFTQTRLIDDATGSGADAPKPLANRVMDFLGADPARVAARALDAVDRQGPLRGPGAPRPDRLGRQAAGAAGDRRDVVARLPVRRLALVTGERGEQSRSGEPAERREGEGPVVGRQGAFDRLGGGRQ